MARQQYNLLVCCFLPPAKLHLCTQHATHVLSWFLQVQEMQQMFSSSRQSLNAVKTCLLEVGDTVDKICVEVDALSSRCVSTWKQRFD
jgi:hypothetical protein